MKVSFYLNVLCLALSGLGAAHAQSLDTEPQLVVYIDTTDDSLLGLGLSLDDFALAHRTAMMKRLVAISGQANLGKALAFAQEAAKKGEPKGHYLLALHAREGLGIDKSLEDYITHLQAAANKSYGPALFELSQAYRDGQGVFVDAKRSAQLLRQALAAGDSEAQLYQAQLWAAQKQFAKAYPLYELAAKAGLVEAQFLQGVALVNGLGVAKDEAAAQQFFLQAAQQRHLRAMVALVQMQRMGIAMKPTPEQMMQWAELLHRTLNRDLEGSMLACALSHAFQFAGRIVADDAEGLSVLQAQADKGDAEALYALSRAYDVGYGLEGGADSPKALAYLQQAAAKGHVLAMRSLAVHYWRGWGCAPDMKTALKYFKQAAEAGDSYAIYALSAAYYSDEPYALGLAKDWSKAYELCLQAAQKGYARAQSFLSYLLYFGHGCKRSAEQSQDWLEKAAANNLPSALFTLGERCLARNVGVSNKDVMRRNIAEALVYYQRAAEMGHAKSQYSLVLYGPYAESIGVSRSPEKDLFWLELAAELAYQPAQTRLAYAYQWGKGVPQDSQKAMRMYRSMALAGNHFAAYQLADIYYSGRGDIPRDLKKALPWFELSIGPSSSSGREPLVYLYMNHELGIDQNLMKALEFIGKQPMVFQSELRYQRAILEQLLKCDDPAFPRLTAAELAACEQLAEQGDVQACYRASVAHLRGDAGEVDSAQALHWLQKVEASGNVEALIDLSLYEQYGIAAPSNEAKALQLMKRLAACQTPKTDYFAGCISERNGFRSAEHQQMFKYLKRSAEAGYADALFLYNKSGRRGE